MPLGDRRINETGSAEPTLKLNCYLCMHIAYGCMLEQTTLVSCKQRLSQRKMILLDQHTYLRYFWTHTHTHSLTHSHTHTHTHTHTHSLTHSLTHTMIYDNIHYLPKFLTLRLRVRVNSLIFVIIFLGTTRDYPFSRLVFSYGSNQS